MGTQRILVNVYPIILYVKANHNGFQHGAVITMTSHECNVISNHRSLDFLLNSLYRLASKKHQSLHYWSSVRGIHQWPVNSLHKGPVTQKKLPFDDVIMVKSHVVEARQNIIFYTSQLWQWYNINQTLTHKRHLISCPPRQSSVEFSECFGENFSMYNGTQGPDSI